MSMVKLQSSDGQVFEVDVEVAKKSKMIAMMLETLGNLNESAAPLPLLKVEGLILKKIIDWLTYHKNEREVPEDRDTIDSLPVDISPWDLTFFKVDQYTLFKLISAANYLKVRVLMDVACCIVANMMKGKTADEIRKTFNIVNDLSRSEEVQLRTLNARAQ